MRTEDDEGLFAGDAAVAPGAEPRGFTPDQMVRCEACLRANPPTRTGCLYCASALPVTHSSARLQRPTLRRLEEWEQGFNCVVEAGAARALNADALGEVAALLRVPEDELRRILDAGETLPLALAPARAEALLIQRKLSEQGLDVRIVSDEELRLVAPPQRARALELTADALIAHTAGGASSERVEWADLLLFVSGRLVTRRLEIEERRGRRAGKEIVDARELMTDELVLDIYAGDQDGDRNWRVSAGSFDFSCLGPDKTVLAAENFSTLVRTLTGRAPRARRDDSYNRLRHALASVWPPQQRTDARGLRRERPGRYSTEAVTSSDSETQFTRYSRLRFHSMTRRRDELA